MLKTDPNERFTIDDVIKNKWIDVRRDRGGGEKGGGEQV